MTAGAVHLAPEARALCEEVAATTTPERLVSAFAHFTHRMHAAGKGTDYEAVLRAHRDIIEAEMIRRMEAGS